VEYTKEIKRSYINGHVFLKELIKLATMTPLQQQVIESGMCFKCHAKTLELFHKEAEMRFLQCYKCLLICVLPFKCQRIIR
jgi:hypothetical protein